MSNEAYKVINAPYEIWLNYGDGPEDEVTDHRDCDEVSWTSGGAATNTNVRYVRADIAQSRIDALEAELADRVDVNSENADLCLEVATLMAEGERLKSELAAATEKGVELCSALKLIDPSELSPDANFYDGVEACVEELRTAAKSLERT